jgi:hypothetical protein
MNRETQAQIFSFGHVTQNVSVELARAVLCLFDNWADSPPDNMWGELFTHNQV